ncbi:MAG: nucleoside phosphorylase [Elusimicrobiaceae bacterium]
MAFPNSENKHDSEALFSPQDYLDYCSGLSNGAKITVPQGVILCYSPQFVRYITATYAPTVKSMFGGKLYSVPNTGVAFFANFGIGAPVASIVLEGLIAAGAKRCLSIGFAGSLQKDINIGDIVICDRSVRDEGVSHHYLKPSKFAYASGSLVEAVKRAMDKIPAPYSVGACWTTDAPYRETIAEIKQYQREGIAVVDMESAALFAVAQHRGAEFCAIFSVSDTLADLKWAPQFHNPRTMAGMETACAAAVAALSV